MTDSTPSHQQIAQRAYEIFIERGQPEGQDLAHWLEAERQLSAAGKQQASTSPQPVHTSASNGGAEAAIAARTTQSNGRGRTPARTSARK